MGRTRKPLRASDLHPEETRFLVGQVVHVWGHAIDDMHVFPERRDKREFLDRIERHLSPRKILDTNYRPYRKLRDEVELLAFCILDNHFHLLIFQKAEGGVISLMKSVLTSYGRYFNETHGRRAQIFESPYSARAADGHDDIRHLISYVHTNHEVLGPNYEFSSHREYMGMRESDWLASGIGLRLFDSKDAYQQVVFTKWEEIRTRKIENRAKNPLPPSRPIKRGRGSHILPQPNK
ncbi:MAG: transposase [Solirubrobacterales bacterium]|nr:transposase [Solirubrobacterales bacterium]